MARLEAREIELGPVLIPHLIESALKRCCNPLVCVSLTLKIPQVCQRLPAPP
jgi:hypothetical protein